ncbi:MAG: IPTL-CTERM sorting domain-containing protein [Methylococcales bacterium]
MTTGTFDPNGASLLVFYNDGDSTNNRDVAVFWGNDSNQPNTFDPAGWSATLSGINFSSGTAALNLIVADGQNFGESGSNTLTINAAPVTFPLFQGASLPVAPGSSVSNGGLWDHASAPIGSLLSPGPNTLTVTGNPEGFQDCLSLIGTVFDLPAGTVTPPPPTPTAIPSGIPTLSEYSLIGLAGLLGLWGLMRLRRT